MKTREVLQKLQSLEAMNNLSLNLTGGRISQLTALGPRLSNLIRILTNHMLKFFALVVSAVLLVGVIVIFSIIGWSNFGCILASLISLLFIWKAISFKRAKDQVRKETASNKGIFVEIRELLTGLGVLLGKEVKSSKNLLPKTNGIYLRFEGANIYADTKSFIVTAAKPGKESPLDVALTKLAQKYFEEDAKKETPEFPCVEGYKWDLVVKNCVLTAILQQPVSLSGGLSGSGGRTLSRLKISIN